MLRQYNKMDCICAKCNYIKNISKQELSYKKELIEYPLIIIKDFTVLIPHIKNNTLLIPNAKITRILMRTINYMFLMELDISHNDIQLIPDIFSLKILKCNNCSITTLPNTLYKLEQLECKNNFISFVPNYKFLFKLDCSNNMIKDTSHLLELTYLICCTNPISSISNKKLTFLKAINCPILVMHKIPSLIRRSSFLIDNKFTWVKENKQEVDLSYLLIDWNTGRHNIKTSKLRNRWDKIMNFILR